MLHELIIKNFAIIEDITIEFDSGLNILTGETGAGKSIIIDALGLLCGEKAQKESIRTGQESLEVQGVFGLESDALQAVLAANDIPADDGELIIRRIVAQGGKNRVYVNGTVQAVGFLKEIADYIVDIHAQNQHHSLLNPARHVQLLDTFLDDPQLPEQYRLHHQAWRRARQIYEEARKGAAENQRALDDIRRQLTEIDKAKLQRDEDDELEARLKILTHAQDIADAAEAVQCALSEDHDAVIPRLQGVQKQLRTLESFDPAFAPYLAEINTVMATLQDMASVARSTARNVSGDDVELEKVETRIRQLDTLKLKYGRSVADILDYAETLRTREANLAHTLDVDACAAEAAAALAIVQQCGEALRHARQKAGAAISAAIIRQLADLGMKGCQFSVNETLHPEPQTSGLDAIEFYLSANRGEAPKPLAKVASGGEMSRIMLAIKGVLAGQGMTSTFVFDEVDTGVSGAVAEMVGEKLKELASRNQVLTITHLPQVAVKSDRHFRIVKATVGDQTCSEVIPLDAEGKIEEIARMLGGIHITDASLEHARQYVAQMGGAPAKAGRAQR